MRSRSFKDSSLLLCPVLLAHMLPTGLQLRQSDERMGTRWVLPAAAAGLETTAAVH